MPYINAQGNGIYQHIRGSVCESANRCANRMTSQSLIAKHELSILEFNASLYIGLLVTDIIVSLSLIVKCYHFLEPNVFLYIGLIFDISVSENRIVMCSIL